MWRCRTQSALEPLVIYSYVPLESRGPRGPARDTNAEGCRCFPCKPLATPHHHRRGGGLRQARGRGPGPPEKAASLLPEPPAAGRGCERRGGHARPLTPEGLSTEGRSQRPCWRSPGLEAEGPESRCEPLAPAGGREGGSVPGAGVRPRSSASLPPLRRGHGAFVSTCVLTPPPKGTCCRMWGPP